MTMPSTDPTTLLLLALLVVLTLLLFWQKLRSREAARELFERWRHRELESVERELSRSIEMQAETSLERWKLEHERGIRKDALKRSQAVVSGKATEHLVPLLPEFPFDPKDARFLGAPVDLVVFDGLSEGDLREIVFVEVKTGASAALSTRERRIRDAVDDGRVRFLEIRIARSEAD
jgi:predicted Holliday junction resolvase-like endonuclease